MDTMEYATFNRVWCFPGGDNLDDYSCQDVDNGRSSKRPVFHLSCTLDLYCFSIFKIGNRDGILWKLAAQEEDVFHILFYLF